MSTETPAVKCPDLKLFEKFEGVELLYDALPRGAWKSQMFLAMNLVMDQLLRTEKMEIVQFAEYLRVRPAKPFQTKLVATPHDSSTGWICKEPGTEKPKTYRLTMVTSRDPQWFAEEIVRCGFVSETINQERLLDTGVPCKSLT
jgi:hypothetical protein